VILKELQNAIERCVECGNLLPPLPVDLGNQDQISCPRCGCNKDADNAFYVEGQIICGYCVFCSCNSLPDGQDCDYCKFIAGKDEASRTMEWLARRLR